VLSPLPAGPLPSDDWPVKELSAALDDWPSGESLADWPEGQSLSGEVPSPEDEPRAELTEEPEALARAGVFAAAYGPRSLAQGAGFASGGTAELVPPGAVLAGLAQDVWAAGLERLSGINRPPRPPPSRRAWPGR
jgi:hypothetical protein